MNRTAIKNFAIWARRYLREQVKARAAQFGITHKSITEHQTVAGGLLVAGQTLNTTEANQYHQLRNRLQDLTLSSSQPQAVDALIDEIAYTWFNRLAALRFMEVNGYIGRVLSSSDSNLVDPDLLQDASSIAEMGDLPGLDLDTLNEWRSFANHDPNPDEFLYRRLLLAQCKALAEGIPALFDPRQNYQALFLPGNLLNQDSIVRRLVKEIPEEDWQNIEVVGWLYQFYISERKDEVIGAKSKVAAADIPAATQLFTPHWIVRYMVENSLGRLWLESHPESRLREYMPYYLENPNDNGEDEKLQALTPQELTVIDPACGSGHILVYTFDLLFEIYKEQGYLERDIPALILTHNLYGLDIDERAAQLASFAVLMKARAKNSRILRKSLVLNIMVVRPTHSQTLPPATELILEDWQPLIEAFQNAENLGSLITPPSFDAEKLKWQLQALEFSDSMFREYVPALQGLLLQAKFLRKQYWVVVANPPYMGGSSFNDIVKSFINKNYQAGKGDLYACYIQRNIHFCKPNGLVAMLTIPNWMFLSSYQEIRANILNNYFLESLVHNGRGIFGSDFGSCGFTIRKKNSNNSISVFKKLYDKQSNVLSNEELNQRFFKSNNYYIKSTDFSKIPGSPIAYWITEKIKNIFLSLPNVSSTMYSDGPCKTGKDERYMRYYWEVKAKEVGIDKSWVLCSKGGDYRRYYGNVIHIINWNLGTQSHYKKDKIARITSVKNQNSRGVTWSIISISNTFSFRELRCDFQFNSVSPTIFSKNQDSNDIEIQLSLLNSKVANTFLTLLNPTLALNVENVLNVPILKEIDKNYIIELSSQMLSLAREDWNNFETSWDFQIHPLLRHNTEHLSEAFTIWQSKSETAFRELQKLEEENNRYWIEAYDLQDELTPEVPDDQITIRRADLNKDIRSLISYAVGCIMGRYSLDKPGLIHAGQPFDPDLHQTQTLSVSSDAIIPITYQAYFDNDIVTRFIEFLRVAYSPDTLTENMNFIANALTLKNGESAQERIRRYFLQEFISDHIQTYKKRPIYWLFTSGKKRAFGALLYLQRYSEDALARIRTDYVLELQVKLDGEIARAQQQLDNTTSSAAKKAATNRLKELQAQQLELRDYQAKLQTQADARINLDLDDGVAYNYTRFKGLVYEGTDLKIADLEKASQWKLELLKQVHSEV
ncbi:SAM-dependent methyltransferase [Nostoc sp. 'Peltigera membranacea cyanobiont' 213]|uniref:BREX-1 system adenine-specific DNA-methyltransferase PglX n=1 Tax=Nostoc sp. 'Peltigera membranacea cyanobiont' 213 TaxID=2014530 RepID=UPI000B950FDF|nr:BREX-1 system adenine-specific DNA-methyltransferase PglX [Nostoc sp. 'Peltigera membranacea cyanobiont' 213]OYD88515.1 SAM-dependent methyltransferase [Nostoc sp. 'Peltigera membranacea cyanobiont' 213]